MFVFVFIGELAAQQGSRIIRNLAQPLLQCLVFLVGRRLIFLAWSALLLLVVLLAGLRLLRSATLLLLLALLRGRVLIRGFLRR